MSTSRGIWSRDFRKISTERKSYVSNSHFPSIFNSRIPYDYRNLQILNYKRHPNNKISSLRQRETTIQHSQASNFCRLSKSEVDAIKDTFLSLSDFGKCCLWSLVDSVLENRIIAESGSYEIILIKLSQLRLRYPSDLWLIWDAFKALCSQQSLLLEDDIFKQEDDIEISRQEYQRKLDLILGPQVSDDHQKTIINENSITTSTNSFQSRIIDMRNHVRNASERLKPTDDTVLSRVEALMDEAEEGGSRAWADAEESPSDDAQESDRMDEDGSSNSGEYPCDDLLRLRFEPLDQSAQQLVERSLAPPHDDSLVIEKFNIPMTRAKLACLRPGVWLNDEVINFYLQLLKERDDQRCEGQSEGGVNRRKSWYFSSFFMSKLIEGDGTYCYSNVKRWSKRFSVFEMDKIFVPVNLANTHWTLAVVFVQARKIRYYDSMSGSGETYLRALARYMCDEAKAKLGVDMDASEWELVRSSQRDTPQQQNGVDCGVFAILFADLITDDLDIAAVSQRDIPGFRRKVCHAIVNGSLTYGLR